jgi:ubiquitin C-terminal hydrolase
MRGLDLRKCLATQTKEGRETGEGKVRNVTRCDGCKSEAKKVLRCNACKQAFYCSKKCQVRTHCSVFCVFLRVTHSPPYQLINWKVHRPQCAAAEAKAKRKLAVTQPYDLYACIQHLGNDIGGHYIAYAARLDSKGRKVWYCFDDDHVRKVTDMDEIQCRTVSQ